MENHHNHHHHKMSTTSEVIVEARYADGKIHVELKDKNQMPPELEINHEKEFHLIVVSEDLGEYKHLHPTQVEKGKFEQEVVLEKGLYKLFVDIQPKNLAYKVTPVSLHIGHHGSSEKGRLQVDHELKKTVNGRDIELSIDSLTAHHPTVFTFHTKNHSPEPYLGAFGHVVILDQAGEQFIHVHPSSEEDTIFETTFHTPGIYKVWGEFKFEGIVHVYPFVIEVTN